MSHSDQRFPLYPMAHVVVLSLSLEYPPLQASSFSHSIISVELEFCLQNPGFKLITEPPSQTALSIQSLHWGLLHLREYVPGEQTLQVFPSTISPGLHIRRLVVMMLELISSPNTSLILSWSIALEDAEIFTP